jgi:shikimate dehydrogenase
MYYNLGIIGFPLKHTLSPKLHNYFFYKTSLNGGYNAFEVEKYNIESLIKFFKKYHFRGFNITVPYKKEIFKYLDFVDDKAIEIDAVNTVLIKNNLLYGYNTDAYGFHQTLNINNIDLSNKDIFILGSGDTTKTILSVIKQFNYKSITLFARDISKAEKIMDKFNLINCKLSHISFLNKSSDCDIIINTTSLGLKGEDFINLSNISCRQAAIDLQYNSNMTSFLKEFINSKINKIDGLPMLIYQGYKAFKIWTDSDFIFSIDEINKKIGAS